MTVTLHGLRVLLLLAMVSVAAAAPLTFHGLVFPDTVAGFARGEPRDFEKTHPGVGYSIPYRRDAWSVTVFIYDLQLKSIPEDPLSPVIKGQLQEAKEAVTRAAANGTYDRATAKGDYNLPDAGRARFQCADFALMPKGRPEHDSVLCLTAWRGKFVKFRVTGPQQPGGPADARRFVEAWSRILWP